ncbi:MAG: metallophosphatase domain-containing protein [Rikenellaceae bacterium]
MYSFNFKGFDIIAISDTHGKHRGLSIPKCDILIHLGDICNYGDKAQMSDFFEWYRVQEAEIKILVAGNHDAEFADGLEAFRSLVSEDISFLDNCKATIETEQGDISFATIPARLKGIGEYWVDLDGVDILLTHCPPRGILDGSKRYGSHRLLQHIEASESRPKLHLFGHVHNDAPSEIEINKTKYINVTQKL